MSTEILYHFAHLLQVQKKISLKSDFIHFFFMILYMYTAPGQGHTAPRGQSIDSTEMSCHFIYLLQISKICLRGLILYNIFHDLILVYSPRAGAYTAPRGQNFDVNRKASSLYPFVASLNEISLKSDFIQIVFMI